MDRTARTPGQLWAGVAKGDITGADSGAASDPLYVKALVVRKDAIAAVVITVDAVALGEIGSIGNDYVSNVRAQLNEELKIEGTNVLINASHCHGSVCADIEQRTVRVVKEAWQAMVPVHIGAGVGHEDRIMENRRLRLKSGRETDVRRAYSLPPDEEVDGVGPVDPEIGILRLDRCDGRPLAVVYNFACHPIQGVPSGGNTADLTGFASRLIEDSLGDGTVALFLQGCAGDINPVLYKEVDHPRDAEPLGNLLGLSTVRAWHEIQTSGVGDLRVVNETIELPRADLRQGIDALQDQQMRLLQSLKGTTLSLKTFIPLMVKYHLSRDFPSGSSSRYVHEEMMGRDNLSRLDAENRRNLELYIENIHVMEQLTRVRVNMDLLRMHQAQKPSAGKDTVVVEVMGLRIGDFVLVTFPGELSVQIGLNIKERSPHESTFVAGVSNGYIYYAPTAEQLENQGGAQEDSDCILAPEWQALYENKAVEILKLL